jgi:hypothetical protein
MAASQEGLSSRELVKVAYSRYDVPLKIKLFLIFIKKNGMKKYREWRYSSTLLNLGSRRRYMVSFTPRERRFRTYRVGGWVGPRAGLDSAETR